MKNLYVSSVARGIVTATRITNQSRIPRGRNSGKKGKIFPASICNGLIYMRRMCSIGTLKTRMNTIHFLSSLNERKTDLFNLLRLKTTRLSVITSTVTNIVLALACASVTGEESTDPGSPKRIGIIPVWLKLEIESRLK